MKILVPLCSIVLVLVSDTTRSFSQTEAGSELISRVYYPDDIIDGKVNYAKLLAESDVVPLLELTDDQWAHFKSLANEFFEIRRTISDQRLKDLKSSGLTGGERRDAFRKATVLEIEDPFDVDARLGEFLLPHQMELIRTGIPLRFFLNSIEDSSRNTPRNSVSDNVSVLLGVSKENAKSIVRKIKRIREGFRRDISEILYHEIISSIDTLGEDQEKVISKLLQLTPKRAELLDVSNVESLIARRVAWKKNKPSKLQLAARSSYQLTTDSEKQWLELSTEQENAIKSLLKSINGEKIRAASNSNGSKLSFSFKGSRNDKRSIAANNAELNKLYDLIGAELLPEQVNELKVLDRWRLLNVRSIDRLLKSEQIKFDKIDFNDNYREILENSIEKLEKVHVKQQELLAEILPDNWKQKLNR